VPTTQGSSTVEGKDIVRNVNPEKTWVFEDENLSTHLIRNAMGGADEMNFRRLLSIPAPFSRSYRDDVTVQ
jgi:pyruvate dehydrogenase phosphatase